jgi:hypothetical protein
VADDRAHNSARQPNINSSPDESLPYKGLIGAKNISSVAIPARGADRKGSNPWDFGGGRLQVSERTPEELGPRDITKFDPKNKYHVAMVKSAAEKDESASGMLLHSGGSFSFPKKEAPQKKQREDRDSKAVAKDKKPKEKKKSNLEKAREVEEAARKSKKL